MSRDSVREKENKKSNKINKVKSKNWYILDNDTFGIFLITIHIYISFPIL